MKCSVHDVGTVEVQTGSAKLWRQRRRCILSALASKEGGARIVGHSLSLPVRNLLNRRVPRSGYVRSSIYRPWLIRMVFGLARRMWHTVNLSHGSQALLWHADLCASKLVWVLGHGDFEVTKPKTRQPRGLGRLGTQQDSAGQRLGRLGTQQGSALWAQSTPQGAENTACVSTSI